MGIAGWWETQNPKGNPRVVLSQDMRRRALLGGYDLPGEPSGSAEKSRHFEAASLQSSDT